MFTKPHIRVVNQKNKEEPKDISREKNIKYDIKIDKQYS